MSINAPSSCRVLHVVSGGMWGGGQRVVKDILRCLAAESDLSLELCLLRRDNARFDPVPRDVVAYEGSFLNPRVAAPAALRLRRLLSNKRPHIVHTHGVDAEIIGGLAVRGLGIRHISHIHDTQDWIVSSKRRHRMRRALTRWVTNGSRATFVAVSEAVKTYVCKNLPLDEARVHVVPNGVDISRFNPDRGNPRGDDDGIVILGTAARLAPTKGLDVLLQAVVRLKREGQKICLRVAGEGEAKTSLRQKSKDCGIEDNVEFLGQVEDMEAFYSGIDVFVLPSLSTEGMPLTILEAMAMRRPVVATTVMGTVEVVRDGVNGCLVPPGNSSLLALAIGRLAVNPTEREKMGRSSRARVIEEFTSEKMCRSLIALYRQLHSVG